MSGGAESAVDHGPNTAIYYRDPDGNTVELQIDNFEESEARELFRRTGQEHPDQLTGRAFDPDRYLAAWRGGATLSELHLRASAGELDG